MLPHSPNHRLPADDGMPLDRIKIEQDIAFLTDRIACMRRQARPNPQMIAHYEAMLRGREAVLSWLQDGRSNVELPRHQA